LKWVEGNNEANGIGEYISLKWVEGNNEANGIGKYNSKCRLGKKEFVFS